MRGASDWEGGDRPPSTSLLSIFNALTSLNVSF